ncbi:MAG: hypothetical protein DRP30_02395 [Thermotoga sp.]|nr:MAG: hypothetical protein DRP30_02395 [Thermotoga sp.]HDM70158.1 hypothetical protein [Thermotogales bacterium]
MSNRNKTMICVTIAGLLFIIAVILDLKYLVIIGAIFDWLPLPTGWMKMEDEEKKKIKKGLVFLHVLVTLVAYLFAVLWFFIPLTILKFLFLEIWWLAVMFGVFITQ